MEEKYRGYSIKIIKRSGREYGYIIRNKKTNVIFLHNYTGYNMSIALHTAHIRIDDHEAYLYLTQDQYTTARL